MYAKSQVIKLPLKVDELCSTALREIPCFMCVKQKLLFIFNGCFKAFILDIRHLWNDDTIIIIPLQYKSFLLLPVLLSSDDNLSEDDINECEKEDPLHGDDDVPHPGDVSKKKRKTKGIAMR